MSSEFEELAGKFRRWAEQAKANIDHWEFQDDFNQGRFRQKHGDFKLAAEMVLAIARKREPK